MAGDWIKIEECMPEKPEVSLIADILKLDDPDTVAGKLVRVWSWATRNCNGDGVTNVTAMKQIDRCAGINNFAKAMIQVGWLQVDNGQITFPKFNRHCSKTAKERAVTGKRVKNHRDNCNDDTVTLTVTKPLPEKRREENINKEESHSCISDIEKENGNKKKPKKQEVELPLPYNSESFQKAWDDWKQYRKEKKSPLTPMAIKQQFADMKEWGEAKAIASIRLSIGSSWTGLFEPKQQSKASATKDSNGLRLINESTQMRKWPD